MMGFTVAPNRKLPITCSTEPHVGFKVCIWLQIELGKYQPSLMAFAMAHRFYFYYYYYYYFAAFINILRRKNFTPNP